MRTQQQALTELCKDFRPFIRRFFLCQWLEEINWHAECKILADGLTKHQQELIFHLQKLHIAKNEFNYSAPRFKYLKETFNLGEYIMVLQKIRQKGECFLISDCFISLEVLREFDRAMDAYPIISYIYGWGIDTDCFNGNTQGKALLDELEKIIGDPKEVKTD